MDSSSPSRWSSNRQSPRSTHYRSDIPLVDDDGSPIPEEWGICCPSCEYNLTGLTVRTCPECGRPFKPHEIWEAERRKARVTTWQTPAYVQYGMLGIPVALTWRYVWNHYPQILLPLLVLPMFELGCWFLRKSAAEYRWGVIVLCSVASIAWWSMVP